MSKEPRPVYAPELDIFGFNKYWKYDKQTDTPYMWAEANCYWYRGRLVASLNGGNVYTAPEIQLAFECEEYRETPNGKAIIKVVCDDPGKKPSFTDKRGNVFTVVEPEPNGGELRTVDIVAMVEANRRMLDIIETATIRKILAVYEKYAEKLDIFHVAFSGGKDSCVLLDLCRKALPKDSFVVVFGDTMMEFPDTYDVIDKIEKQCAEDGINFYRAYSHLRPEESWELFGPPSRVQRWCCSVHKSTPQTLKLREITGKQDYTGLDYVGIRAEESTTRAEYGYENFGKKQKGQYSHNSILEWTSAEVWLYIYANSVIINRAYTRGSQRVGCLCCPMGGGKASFVEFKNYKKEVTAYFNIIKKSYSGKNVDSFCNNGGWNARKNGRELANNESRCTERYEDDSLFIDISNPTSNWREWIKTVDTNNEYTITNIKDGYSVKIAERILKDNPLFSRLFRQAFRKAAYCIGCRVCETNCPHGSISFENRIVKISNCKRCHECHAIESGCLAFHSLRHPQGGGNHMKSLNTFANHAPKTEWFASFFQLKESFFTEHSLGPMQISMFNRFLKDAGLQNNKRFTPLADLIVKIGWDTDTAFGILLINLVHENPQFKWYVETLEVGRVNKNSMLQQSLIALDIKPNDAKSIIYAFKRLTETPFGTKLNWGYVADNGDILRTACNVSDPRVILYGLYVYNEKANTHYEFRLNSLYENIEQDGIPPTQIFGLSRETMIPLLLGLTAKYPDFINATFTNDLDKISLKEDKTPTDVLNLFKEGN